MLRISDELCVSTRCIASLKIARGKEIPNCGKEDFSITVSAAADEAPQEHEGGYTGQNLQFEPRAKSFPYEDGRTDHSSSLTWNDKRRGVF